MAKHSTVYVLYCDAHGPSGYFIRLGLGIFWECGTRAEAKEFQTRSSAVKVLHASGKHHYGWRVLKTDHVSDECPMCSTIGAGPLCKAHR